MQPRIIELHYFHHVQQLVRNVRHLKNYKELYVCAVRSVTAEF